MKQDLRVETALEFLAANCHAQVTVRDLAISVGLSPSRFSHLFTLRVGQTPGKHLRSIRPCAQHPNCRRPVRELDRLRPLPV